MHKNMSVLKDKNFLKLELGALISSLGTNIESIAISLFIYNKTGSTVQLATVLAFALIPKVIFYPIGGVISDYRNKKYVMAITDYISSAAIFISFVFVKCDFYAVATIYILVLLESLLAAFFLPSAKSIIPNLFIDKEDIAMANSVSSFILTFTSLVSPIAGAVLLKLIGLNTILLINAFSFLLSGILEQTLTLAIEPKSKRENIVLSFVYKKLVDGFKYTLHKKTIFFITVTGFIINLVLGPFMTLGYIYISQVALESGDMGYGMMNTAVVVGSLIGASVYAIFIKKSTDERMFIQGILLLGILTMVFNIATIKVNLILYVCIVIALLMGLYDAIINICISNIVHTTVEMEYMSRVFSFIGTICMSSVPIGQFIFGLFLDKFGYTVTTAFSGLLIIVTSIFMYSRFENNSNRGKVGQIIIDKEDAST